MKVLYKISYIRSINIILLLIFITKFFQSTPFEREFFQIQAGFIVLMGFYFIKEFFQIGKYKNEPVIKYFFFLILFMFFFSAIRANMVFGQSYYLGLLAKRGVFMIMAAVWIYNYLIKGKISFQNLEDIFILLGWLSFFVFTYIYFFVNPNTFIGSSFVNYDPLRGYRYKFQAVLVTFITLYYLIKYREKGKLKDLLFYLLLFSFALFIISGRGNILILLFVSFIILIRNINISKIIKLTGLIFAGVIIIYFLSDTLFTKFLPDFLVRLNQAFEVLGGKATSDASANSRILQSGIIFDFLSKHTSSIWFGVGHVSNHFRVAGGWGFNAIFGYLYPTDTGLIGALFLWGIVGLIFTYIIPVKYIIQTIRKTPKTKNIFIITLNYFLIFTLIASLYTGNLVFNPYFIYFLLGILLAHKKLYKNGNISKY